MITLAVTIFSRRNFAAAIVSQGFRIPRLKRVSSCVARFLLWGGLPASYGTGPVRLGRCEAAKSKGTRTVTNMRRDESRG